MCVRQWDSRTIDVAGATGASGTNRAQRFLQAMSEFASAASANSEASPAAVAAHASLGEPSHWVCHWTHLVAPGGAVLDVASGAGRHARWFAGHGHPVSALDRDAAALAVMRDEPRITTHVADLEGAPWPLPDDAKFAAVVVTNYLHRPLFPNLLAALAPGGVLIYETFAHGNQTVGKPSNPAFLLAPGELLDVVRPRLRVVAFQDGFLAQPRPAYVQRICAILEAQPASGDTQALPQPCYELAG
jgi:SAM-dependent methyltransferase